MVLSSRHMTSPVRSGFPPSANFYWLGQSSWSDNDDWKDGERECIAATSETDANIRS